MTKSKRSLQWIGVCSFGLAAMVGTQALASKTVTGTLVKITDGDTVNVETADGKVHKVRYLGIDTPEVHFMNQAQDYGPEATDHLHELFNAAPAKLDRKGTKVLGACKDKTTGKDIEVEVEFDGKDKHKRDLGYVYIGKINTNLQMVEDGYAFPYLYCVKDGCDKGWVKQARVAEFVDACKSARSKGLGIFNKKKPLNEIPSEFRRRIGKTPRYQYLGNFETKELFQPDEVAKVDPCLMIRFDQPEDAENLGYKF